VTANLCIPAKVEHVVIANLRTPNKVEHVVTAQSIVHRDGCYVVPTTGSIDGLSLTPCKIGSVKEAHHKFELLHFGYVAPWNFFRAVELFGQLFLHEDSSLPAAQRRRPRRGMRSQARPHLPLPPRGGGR
jgi:hypothetical protein